jgi:hypothetical protein
LPENIEPGSDFFGVLADLVDYLPELTLVGGWVPYIYANFLWRNPAARPVFTSDVDWGVAMSSAKSHKKTIFEVLSGLKYSERHLEIGKLQPVVFYRKNKTRLDFIAPLGGPDEDCAEMMGREVAVSRLEHFDFLLKHAVEVPVSRGGNKYVLRCPRPSAFVCHKCATFTDRTDRQKMAKDLYYAYFVLRYAPDVEKIKAEMRGYSAISLYAKAMANLREYFSGEIGRGSAMVAQENGPDYYIDDLEADIHARFLRIIE